MNQWKADHGATGCSFDPIPAQISVVSGKFALKDCVDSCVGQCSSKSVCEMLCVFRWKDSDRSAATIAAKANAPDYGDNTGGVRWLSPCQSREGQFDVEISSASTGSIVLHEEECSSRVTMSPSFLSPGTTVSFRGAYSDAVRCIRNFSYFSDEDFLCTDELTVTVNDLGSQGAGDPGTVTEYVNVEMTLVNDAPTIAYAVSSTATVPEDSGEHDVSGFVVSDSDADAYPMEADISLDDACDGGMFTLASLDGLQFMKNTHGTGVRKSAIFRAPLVETNKALATVKFTPGKDYTGTCLLTLKVNDQGNYPDMLKWAVPQTITITVTGVNDAPQIVGLASNVTVVEGGTIKLAPEFKVVDVDLDQTSLAKVILSFSVISGAGIAEWSTMPGKTSKTLKAINLQSYVRDKLVYKPDPSDEHFNGRAVVLITVSDEGNSGSGGPLTGNATIDVIVTPVADMPVLTQSSSAAGNEDTAIPVKLSMQYSPRENVSVFIRPTPHATTLSTGRLISRNTTTGQTVWLVPAADVNSLSVTAPQDFNGEISLNIHARSEEPSNRDVAEARAVFTVTVLAVNDPIEVVVPAAVILDEDSAVMVNGFDVRDVDLAADATKKANVKLTTGKGTRMSVSFQYVLADKISFLGTTAASKGMGVTSVEFEASLQDAQALLRGGIWLTPLANFNGHDVITMIANDKGGVGAPSSPTMAEGTVNVTINAVNDFPVLVINGKEYTDTVDESSKYYAAHPEAFSKFNRRLADAAAGADNTVKCDEDQVCALAGVSLTDVDDGLTPGKPFRLQVTAGTGAISMDTSAAPGAVAVSRMLQGHLSAGKFDVTYEAVGTLGSLNGILSSLQFQGHENTNGAAAIKFLVEDMCCPNSSSPIATIRHTLMLDVQPVNDAPLISADVFSDRTARRATSVTTTVNCSFNTKIGATTCRNVSQIDTSSSASNERYGFGDQLAVAVGGKLWIEALVSDDASEFPTEKIRVRVSCLESRGHFDVDMTNPVLSSATFLEGAPTGSSSFMFEATLADVNEVLRVLSFTPDYYPGTPSGDMNLTIFADDKGVGSSPGAASKPALTTTLSIAVFINRTATTTSDSGTGADQPVGGAEAALYVGPYVADVWEDTRVNLAGVTVQATAADTTYTLDVAVATGKGSLTHGIPAAFLTQAPTTGLPSGPNVASFQAVGTRSELTTLTRFLFVDPGKEYSGPLMITYNLRSKAGAVAFVAVANKTFNVRAANDAPVLVMPRGPLVARSDSSSALFIAVADIADVDAESSDLCRLTCTSLRGVLRVNASVTASTSIVLEGASFDQMKSILASSSTGLQYTTAAVVGGGGAGAGGEYDDKITCTVNDLGVRLLLHPPQPNPSHAAPITITLLHPAAYTCSIPDAP